MGSGICSGVRRSLRAEGQAQAVSGAMGQGAVGGMPLMGFAVGCASNADAFMPAPQQFTYFQGVGGIEVDVVSGELTYGLERLAMYVQGVDNVYDLKFNKDGLTYGEVFLENERQQSEANFHGYDVEGLRRRCEDMEAESRRLLAMTGPQGQPLVLPAYDQVLKASHLFNLMDARGAIAVAERQSYIGRIRDLCKACALAQVEQERKTA